MMYIDFSDTARHDGHFATLGNYESVSRVAAWSLSPLELVP